MKRLFLILLPFALKAQEAAHEVSKQAAPERDMMPWLWANFIILAVGLGYLCKKYGGPFLAARSEGIRKDIVESEKTQAQANAKVAEINAKLANLDSEIAAIKLDYARDQAHEHERLLARQQIEIGRIRQQASQEIESTTKAARITLQHHAAKLALELAEQKISTRMNPETQKKLASDFVESLS